MAHDLSPPRRSAPLSYFERLDRLDELERDLGKATARLRALPSLAAEVLRTGEEALRAVEATEEHGTGPEASGP